MDWNSRNSHNLGPRRREAWLYAITGQALWPRFRTWQRDASLGLLERFNWSYDWVDVINNKTQIKMAQPIKPLLSIHWHRFSLNLDFGNVSRYCAGIIKRGKRYIDRQHWVKNVLASLLWAGKGYLWWSLVTVRTPPRWDNEIGRSQQELWT